MSPLTKEATLECLPEQSPIRRTSNFALISNSLSTTQNVAVGLVQTQQLNKLGTSLLALSHTLENLANQAQHSRTLISNLTLDAMSSTSQDKSTTLHSTMIPSQQQAQLSESRQQQRIGKRSRRCSRSLTSAACTKVQSVGEQNTQTGQVYSNDPLGLLTAHGRDTNLWHSFLPRRRGFQPR